MLVLSQRLMLALRCAAVRGARCYSTTIDIKEIEHHSKFGNDWWNKESGPMKPLHAMNELRLPFIRNGLINVNQLSEEACDKPNYLKGLKILDVGCGGGILTMPLARLGGDITGLDASSTLIDVAKNYASTNLKPEVTIKFITSSIEDHELTHRNSYDVVILSEVMEHVSQKQAFLQSCVNTLKPGGSLFITTINRTNLAWLTVIIFAEDLLNMVPQGNHEWSKFVTTDELKKYLKSVGCKILQIYGMTYIPYRNIWCWIPNNSICYAVHAIKQT